MARRRQTIEQATLTGAVGRNPGRFKGRKALPDLPPVGDAPAHLTGPQRAAWQALVREIPWLKRPDRCLTQLAAVLVARMRDDPAPPVALMRELRACLSHMGASPVDRQRVLMPDLDDDPDDPATEFIN